MKLSELIDQVRAELEVARRPKADAMLSLEECELEVSVELEVNAKGELAVNVLGTGGKFGSDAVRTSSHKVRVKFSCLPDKPFREAVAEIKEMLSHMQREGIPRDAANALVSRYFQPTPTYVTSGLPRIWPELGEDFKLP